MATLVRKKAEDALKGDEQRGPVRGYQLAQGVRHRHVLVVPQGRARARVGMRGERGRGREHQAVADVTDHLVRR